MKEAEEAAKKAYDEKMAAAGADSDAELAKAGEETDKEIGELRAAAAEREDSIVDQVISSLAG